MSILAITLVVIATKKAVGNAMAVLPVLFALYALLGKHIPGIFGHGGFSVRRFFMRMYMVDEMMTPEEFANTLKLLHAHVYGG